MRYCGLFINATLGFRAPMSRTQTVFRYGMPSYTVSPLPYLRQLAEVGAKRPSTLEGIETLSRLYMLLDMICPDMLCNEVIIKQRSRETIEQEKEAAEELLERFLQENQA
jgi:hypothetical protein